METGRETSTECCAFICLQALSKAQAREKRRLLAARTQAARVDKTLEKKREQLAAVRRARRRRHDTLSRL